MTANKKVIHILNTLLPSGAEMMLYNSAELWVGYDKYILATQGDVGEFAAALKQAGYTIEHIYNKSAFKQYWNVYRYLAGMKYDVIHIHRESKSYLYALVARLACPRAKIVRTVHNVFKTTGLETARHILTRRFERMLGVKYVAIGPSVYENEAQELKNPCSIIHNWCDERYEFIPESTHSACKKELGIAKDEICFLSVGNCNDTKNHKIIIEALSKINPCVDIKWKYIHVGSGALTNEEIELCQSYHIEKNVVFLGRVQPDLYLKACDLFLMPSKYEGVGISALEALSCGIPVLLTDVPGLRDFKRVKSDSNQIYYAEPQVDSFVLKLTGIIGIFKTGELLNHEEQSKAFHDAYNKKKSVQEYLKIYEH